MKLHFKESGRGRPLILLHGLLGSLDNWHAIEQPLAEHFHVLALDQRNHGQSPHSPAMDYPLMAEDLNEFLAGRGIERASFIGHSMGGKVAMQFAFQSPGKVERLLLEDITPRAYPPDLQHIFMALLALDLTKFKTRQEIEKALAPGIPNLLLRRFLLKNLDQNPDGTFFWRINLRGLSENYPNLVGPVAGSVPFQKPVLLIRGGMSHYVNPEDERLMRTFFPQVEIKTIAEAEHWVHGDTPEEFLAMALDFL
jgi:pimeloyl-ACP methyl ester carboxylesterase